MRNKIEVKNVDVQLYLEDYEKLQFKMEYLDGSTLDLKVVQKHAKALKKVKDSFEKDEDSSTYTYIIEFGLAFAEYAEAALASSSVSKDISDLNKQIESMVFETTKFERIVEFYNDQATANFYGGERGSGLNAPAFAVVQKPVQ